MPFLSSSYPRRRVSSPDYLNVIPAEAHLPSPVMPAFQATPKRSFSFAQARCEHPVFCFPSCHTRESGYPENSEIPSRFINKNKRLDSRFRGNDVFGLDRFVPVGELMFEVFEGEEFDRIRCAVTLADGTTVKAWTFVASRQATPSATSWNLATWQRNHKREFLRRLHTTRT